MRHADGLTYLDFDWRGARSGIEHRCNSGDPAGELLAGESIDLDGGRVTGLHVAQILLDHIGDEPHAGAARFTPPSQRIIRSG